MSQINTTEADGVLTVTFTRDEKLNAVSPPMLEGLRAAVQRLGESPDVRVLVITAEGRAFTAGMDIATIAAETGTGPDGAPPVGTVLRRNYRRLHLLFDEIEAIEKPVVLAAQGPCLGFGLELAVSCDFRLASERATFSLPEIRNLAVLPGSGGISRLTRLVGAHWARWLVMAGKEVDAELARTMGLVHEVYPEDVFAERVQQFAHELAALPAQAVGLAKLGIEAARSTDRTSARDFDRIANTLLLSSEDHHAAIARFTSRKR
ncbi:MAG: putative acyl-CoA hydratase [Frankiales bacterium]|nr:putative acyl-CoA hydratase [Frankiales bacterium]